MEELELNLEGLEFEVIEKLNAFRKFKFPVIYLNSDYMYCNKAAKSLVGDAVRWYVSTEYVVGLKAPKFSTNAFSVHWRKDIVARMTMPKQLYKAKKLRDGYYKLYKYKDGFAFKRYEPIDLRSEDL